MVDLRATGKYVRIRAYANELYGGASNPLSVLRILSAEQDTLAQTELSLRSELSDFCSLWAADLANEGYSYSPIRDGAVYHRQIERYIPELRDRTSMVAALIWQTPVLDFKYLEVVKAQLAQSEEIHEGVLAHTGQVYNTAFGSYALIEALGLSSIDSLFKKNGHR